VQASSAAVPPGAAEAAGSAVVGLHEEHHPQPAAAGTASHQGHRTCTLAGGSVMMPSVHMHSFDHSLFY